MAAAGVRPSPMTKRTKRAAPVGPNRNRLTPRIGQARALAQGSPEMLSAIDRFENMTQRGFEAERIQLAWHRYSQDKNRYCMPQTPYVVTINLDLPKPQRPLITLSGNEILNEIKKKT